MPPVISAEEWASVHAENANGLASGLPSGFYIDSMDGDLVSGTFTNPFPPLVLVALINAALPEDDPHKITRADVDMLESSADNDHDAYLNREAMRRLAAKLRALLPPKNPDAT